MTGPAAWDRWRPVVAAAAAGLLLLGAVFAVQLIVELAVPPAAAGHHDILAFWSAGRLILQGKPGDLYDAASLTAIQREVIPEPVGMNGYMPFINPPLAAVVFAPFAAFPAWGARLVWGCVNVVLAVGAAAWLSRGMARRERLLATALIATSFPMYHALAEGQWSILLLAAGLAAMAAARRGAWGTTGVALAVLWLKPQFIILPLLALALGRQWRALGTAVLTGAVAVLAALPFTGLPPNQAYVGYLLDVVTSHFSGAGAGAASAWQGDLASTEGLNGLLVGWLGQGSVGLVNVLWAGLVLVVGGLYAFAMRSVAPGFATAPGRTMLAAGIALVMLVNPNQFVQDCVLLFLCLDAVGPLERGSRLPAVVLIVAVADLTFLDLQVPALHLFPLVLVAAVLWTCRLAIAGSGRSSLTGPAGAG
jgi:hypothetical protein